jgi:hypothetical protein
MVMMAWPSIWIHAKYIWIYDFLKHYYHNPTMKAGPAPGAVLMGQPGIGDSKI